MIKLNNITLSLAAAALLSVGFTGCGSDDDSSTSSSTQTGTFVDAPVAGLHYITATQDGYTDANGSFKYVAGETVEFKLGTLSLGKGTAGALVTPYTIADNNDTATNIALLLQNCDANRSNSDVLDLSNLKDCTLLSDINLSVDPVDMETKVSTLLAIPDFKTLVDTNTTLIDHTHALTNMNEYITEHSTEYNKEFTVDYLDGKTLYRQYVDLPTEPVETIAFDLNTTTSFTDENVDPAVTRDDAYAAMDGMIRIEDGKLYEYTTDAGSYNDGVNIYTITSIDDDKIVCSVQIPEGTTTVYFYFDEAKAQANSISVENGFGADWLDNRIMWSVGDDEGDFFQATFEFKDGKNTAQIGLIDTITAPIFNNDYNVTDGTIIVDEIGGERDDGTVKQADDSDRYQKYKIYSIDGTKIITCNDDASVLECSSTSNNYQAFFTDKADAQAYLDSLQ